MILSVFLADPTRLMAQAEALAALDLGGPLARTLRRFLLDLAAEGEVPAAEIVTGKLGRAGLQETVERLSALVRPGDRWVLDPHADPMRLEDALRQAITLQRRERTLHSELRAAERALADENSEANLAWLREIHSQLSSLEGAEADAGDDQVRQGP
jgi:DNA primase